MLKRLAPSLSIVMLLIASSVAQDDAKTDKTKQDPARQDSPADAEPAKLEVGAQAPDWELVGSDGKTYKLSSYRGKQGVIVAWYPAALTGG